MSCLITGADLEAFSRDGFVLKRGLYSRDEMQLLRDIAKGEQSGFRTGTGRSRASEATAAAKGAPQQLNPLGQPRMSEIYHFERHDRALVSPSIYDALLFGERMVHCMECLILRPDDESRHRGTYQAVTLHHRKLTMKDVHSFLPDEQGTRRADNGQGQPGYTDASTGEAHLSQHSGNRWQWHQDYGYWYGNGGVGGPFPDMVIACVAIDRAHRGNGCLQMLRGSHRMGRLDTVQEEWGERHIDPGRIKLALRAGCEPVFCEQEPGDCLFFHANTVHQSLPNADASQPRWCYLNAFDSLHNAQFYKEGAVPAPVVADSCMMEWGGHHLAAVRAAGGDLAEALRQLRAMSALVRDGLLRHGAGDGDGGVDDQGWETTKERLYAAPPVVARL